MNTLDAVMDWATNHPTLAVICFLAVLLSLVLGVFAFLESRNPYLED